MTVILDGASVPDGPSGQVIDRMTAAVEQLLQRCGLEGAQVDITLVEEERIRELNRRYRGVDRPTDVLSFPQWEPEEIQALRLSGNQEEITGLPLLLGDVVISWPRTLEQAQNYGHTAEREFAFLAVHGTLHLIGYDHQTPEEEVEMQAIAEEILMSAGLPRE